jgi:inhibitor of the pro-sigma K processing machinery
MDKSMGMILMVAACVLVLVIGVLRRKAAFLLHFLVRALVGALAIGFTNSCLSAAGIGIALGLNLLTLCVVGSLGIGGYGMLYAILLYMSM